MLSIDGLRLRLGGFELGPLSLDVREGEYFVLLGPSGAGKTTLLEWIAGFRSAQAGELRIDGERHTDSPPQARRLGVVYQDSALFPHLSVRDNIAYPLRRGAERAQPVQRAEATRKVGELAALLQIEPLLDAHVQRLSGGERRRVAVARALAAERRILLLDEPLSALDPTLHREVRQELAALQRRLGLTVVHITHRLSDARALASRLGVLVDGKLEQVGPPDTLFERPDNARVARALSVPNFITGQASPTGAALRICNGTVEIPAKVPGSGELRAIVAGVIAHPDATAERIPAAFLGYERPARGGTVALVRIGEGPSRLELEATPADLNTDLNASLKADLAPGTRVHLDFRDADFRFY